MDGWTGVWRNQHGSTVTITATDGGRIEGLFRTALGSSPFAGRDAPVTGVVDGSAIAFVCAAGDAGDSAGTVVSYTGKLEDGRMETLWFVVTGDRPWWSAVLTNHDTFERLPGGDQIA
jgi:hypothetical protein